MLREVVIDLVSRFSVLLALDACISWALRITDDNTILRLWVHHDARHGVLFSFYCDHELESIVLVGGEDVEEIFEDRALLVSVCGDDPIVSMVH